MSFQSTTSRRHPCTFQDTLPRHVFFWSSLVHLCLYTFVRNIFQNGLTGVHTATSKEKWREHFSSQETLRRTQPHVRPTKNGRWVAIGLQTLIVLSKHAQTIHCDYKYILKLYIESARLSWMPQWPNPRQPIWTRIREPIHQRVLVDELDLVTEPLLLCPLPASLHHGLSEFHSDHGVHACEADQGTHASTIVAVQLNSLHPWPHLSPVS